jgi:F420-dependent oxidoreductase-like protein
MAGGNRTIAGLGVSGPQVVEGWYGQSWGSPNQRLREYVDIMRQVFRRESPVSLAGREYTLPYAGDDSLGQGKPLKSILHTNPDLPIWIASGGPANTALAAEVADGWLPMGWAPDTASVYDEALAKGRAKRDPRLGELEIFTSATVKITDDVGSIFEEMAPLTAMYVGGMGSATHNYHRAAMARRGFPDEAARIHELWMAGHREEAVAAVPHEYFDNGGLFGSVERIRQRWAEVWDGCAATGVIVRTSDPEALDLMADLAGTRDTGTSEE